MDLRGIIPLLPVSLPWECHKSGDCCRIPEAVTMTVEEAALIVAQRPDIQGRLSAHPENAKFVKLAAQPCPLLTDEGLCSVYDIRPYNCRRFQCYRPDPAKEPFRETPELGCVNLAFRLLKSRPVRRDYTLKQRKHARWARKHGWTDTNGKS
jgi:Fe-S-cluster containining protein